MIFVRIALARIRSGCLLLANLVVLLVAPLAADAAEAVHHHGLAAHGLPELSADFSHFPYVNPKAPKGGALRLGAQGTFDTINSMSVRGSAPQALVPYVVQPLMMRSLDEPFTIYGLLAQSIATPEDRSYVEFKLNPKARFADGQQVTSKDVRFSWELFSTKGRPNYRRYAQKIAKVEEKDAQTIRFTFHAGGDLELPLILGLMPILPAHAVDPEKFNEMGFTPFMGSGPYRIASVEPGSKVTLERRPDYWGANLPTQRGIYNFDTIILEFFRDSNTLFEAFKTGLYDLRTEIDPTKWLSGYSFAAAEDGRVIRDSFQFQTPKGMSGFVFNTRKPVFQDMQVRAALSALFDFEWLNRNLFSGVYKRTSSFFDESELAFSTAPASPLEDQILAKFPGLPADIRDGSWRPPVTDGSGRDRKVIRKAVDLLKTAGYGLKDGVMVQLATGEPLTFEIMVTTREKERVALAFADGLRQIGIRPSIRLVDSSQYWARLRQFSFDMIVESYAPTASPGNEQANRWSSVAADAPASLNWAGVKSEAVDFAIQEMLAARTREDYVASVRALDRVLIAGHYVVPLYHLSARWVARWKHISRHNRMPRYEFSPDIFWFDANR